VIPDVRLKSAGRNIFGVRQTVGLDLIGLASHEFRRGFKIANRVIKTSQRQISMSSVSKKPRLIFVQHEPA
jgi:hypothetical protein